MPIPGDPSLEVPQPPNPEPAPAPVGYGPGMDPPAGPAPAPGQPVTPTEPNPPPPPPPVGSGPGMVEAVVLGGELFLFTDQAFVWEGVDFTPAFRQEDLYEAPLVPSVSDYFTL